MAPRGDGEDFYHAINRKRNTCKYNYKLPQTNEVVQNKTVRYHMHVDLNFFFNSIIIKDYIDYTHH